MRQGTRVNTDVVGRRTDGRGTTAAMWVAGTLDAIELIDGGGYPELEFRFRPDIPRRLGVDAEYGFGTVV
jgi:hypothetical protein